MPEVTSTKPEIKKTCSVPPFAIEADHHRNCDLLLQGIVGVRLRSRIISSRTVTDKKSGRKMVPEGQAIGLGKYPEIPGMQLHVNPAELSYRIIDPLVRDKDLCLQIKHTMRQHLGYSNDAELRGVPEQTGTLDKHRMKTLVREIMNMVKAGEARVIKGVCPDEEDISGLEGKFLLNPGSMIQNYMPQFEEDYAAYADSLNRVGG